ncbi:MAG: DUF4180 domain-containing protein [Bacteroidales bacterium]
MIKYHKTDSPGAIAELVMGTATITSPGDILDIMGEIGYQGCSKLIVHSGDLIGDFFDLRTGLAGEILQKFSNYRMRLAIVGDFSHLTSRSWHDFIRESNRGRTISFLPTLNEALSVLT